jgi:hypothetical protein
MNDGSRVAPQEDTDLVLLQRNLALILRDGGSPRAKTANARGILEFRDTVARDGSINRASMNCSLVRISNPGIRDDQACKHLKRHHRLTFPQSSQWRQVPKRSSTGISTAPRYGSVGNGKFGMEGGRYFVPDCVPKHTPKQANINYRTAFGHPTPQTTSERGFHDAITVMVCLESCIGSVS